ncbi:MAG TPA: DUF5996 family protein [Acidimicrobiales bacterium]|nr:DUF5996 family protein [Acidimicrobiales bacterium]
MTTADHDEPRTSGAGQRWPALSYGEWRLTCDTLHAHTQLLGKLATRLAPPEPQLQHAALRLTARGWETAPLPAPDRSGALVALLDLRTHEAVIEHSDGRVRRVPLTPHRSVGDVATAVLGAVEGLVGPMKLNLTPQEVPWTAPLDEDDMHHTYEPAQVATYFSAATRAALVLAELRAPYRGRSSPVNAWWGTFDLAIALYSGEPAEAPTTNFIMRNSANAQQIEIGWWPGDNRHPQAAFFGFAVPAPSSFATGALLPPAAHWDPGLGEYILEWDDVIGNPEPHQASVQFGRSLIAHACMVCDWGPVLSASARGELAPLS